MFWDLNQKEYNHPISDRKLRIWISNCQIIKQLSYSNTYKIHQIKVAFLIDFDYFCTN